MKILVVEDEPASLKLAHLVLAAGGHEVTGAEAADQALDEIVRSAPDAILLDLELPMVNGLSLARRLKSDPQTRHIVIIAVTSYPEHYPRARALAAGCEGYLVKPIDTRKLPQQVEAEVINAS